LENKKAQKLIDKIVQDLNHAGIIINTLTEDLKELREFARKEQNPLLVKLLRLTYEHIGENETFLIEIPKDEPLDEEEEAENEEAQEAAPDSQIDVEADSEAASEPTTTTEEEEPQIEEEEEEEIDHDPISYSVIRVLRLKIIVNTHISILAIGI